MNMSSEEVARARTMRFASSLVEAQTGGVERTDEHVVGGEPRERRRGGGGSFRSRRDDAYDDGVDQRAYDVVMCLVKDSTGSPPMGSPA